MKITHTNYNIAMMHKLSESKKKSIMSRGDNFKCTYGFS